MTTFSEEYEKIRYHLAKNFPLSTPLTHPLIKRMKELEPLVKLNPSRRK